MLFRSLVDGMVEVFGVPGVMGGSGEILVGWFDTDAVALEGAANPS